MIFPFFCGFWYKRPKRKDGQSRGWFIMFIYIYMFIVLSYHMNGIFFQSWPEQHLQRVMMSIPLSTMNPRIPGILSLGDNSLGSWIRSPGKVAYCHQRDRECGIPACSFENMAGRLGRLPHAEMEDYSHRDSVNLGVNHVLLHCLHW